TRPPENSALKPIPPLENSAPTKPTQPLENLALPKPTWAPENLAPAKLTSPPENLAPANSTQRPENSARPKPTRPPEHSARTTPTAPPENLAPPNPTSPPPKTAPVKSTLPPENTAPKKSPPSKTTPVKSKLRPCQESAAPSLRCAVMTRMTVCRTSRLAWKARRSGSGASWPGSGSYGMRRRRTVHRRRSAGLPPNHQPGPPWRIPQPAGRPTACHCPVCQQPYQAALRALAT